MLPAAAVLSATFLLVGCIPTETIITPQPEPNSTPVFATDEDALAAATEAYAKYVKVSDEITGDEGAGAERVSELVTPDQLVNELAGFKDYAAGKVRTQGRSIAYVASLQQYTDAHDGTADVVIYVCVDVSGVRIVNETGEDVTPADRRDVFPLEVEFEVRAQTPIEMKISRSEPWAGDDYCK